MGVEIERKYLVKNDAWRDGAQGVAFRQGFLSTQKERVVRVRMAGEKGTLTIKGVTRDVSRVEFEYEIPKADAEQLLDQLCERPLIEKTRYKIEHAGLIWEVDIFEGENAGLILAEVELEDENQAIELPDWVGEEVSSDARYYNSNLVKNPFSSWRD
ncbi:MAG: CYTH domain-containing protein [Magnetococcales bacterium]|nr:CYTH domain-containing protein [Magnetococcales bacterium]